LTPGYAMALEDKLRSLPESPGVYLMKNARREVIYIGKAKNLRNRVMSYFKPPREENRLITIRISDVQDVDWVVTSTEKEALILENSLIKQFRPRFNVNLKDDKTFVSVEIDLSKPYPVPRIVRRKTEGKSLYFGPYSSARAARDTLKTLHRIFPLRKCKLSECRSRTRPCVYHELGQCLGPCCGGISEEDYEAMLEQVVLFLRGHTEDVLKALREEMQRSAAEMKFEKAAKIRDRMRAIELTLERQRMASSMDETDRDVFGIHRAGARMAVQIFFIRNGRMEDTASYLSDVGDMPTEEAFRSFLNQFYSTTRFIPKEILLPCPTEDETLLTEWLSELKQQKIEVISPSRGDKMRLVELANRNAQSAYDARLSDTMDRDSVLKSIQNLLGLPAPPRRIECFDISNLNGREAVGAMVVFQDGDPFRKGYRRFRIKTVEGSDDFAMLREVLARRFGKDSKETAMPDLLVVDGGKGQLGAAADVMKELKIEGVPIAGLAKSRKTTDTASDRILRSEERLFVPRNPDPIVLEQGTPEFFVFTRARDEAHRFAITYHRRVLEKEEINASPLRRVKGLGPARRRLLLERFGTTRGVLRATLDELSQVKGIGPALARQVFAQLHPEDRKPDAAQ